MTVSVNHEPRTVLRPNSFIFTLFGDLVHRASRDDGADGSLWIGALIALMAPFGVSAAAVTETFTRINDVRESYEAAVLVVAETTAEGKAPPGKTSTARLEYWDYWREIDIGGGKTAKEFLFVEMNSDTGWFQIWRGREFFS